MQHHMISPAASQQSQSPQTDSAEGGNTAPDQHPVVLALPSLGSNDNDPSRWPAADPQHAIWEDEHGHPFPAWVTGFRPHQLQAVEEIVDAYNRGAEAVFLDAPTGAGKTLIGEMARRIVGGKAAYVCHSIGLQEQFVRDFPLAKLLKGKANYRTQLAAFPEVTCGDCTLTTAADHEDADCTWCMEPTLCAYQVAKNNAMWADTAVVNTAYLLAEANHVGRLVAGRELIIMDEADTLESIIMSTAEFRVTAHMMRGLGIEVVKKGSHAPTVAAWVEGELKDAVVNKMKGLQGGDVETVRERARLARVADRCDEVAKEIVGDAWVRDYDSTDALILKPVTVDHVGEEWVWKHGKRWLLMSATLVSVKEMTASLGMEDMKVETVTVPMTFPLENRKVYAVPVAKMTKALAEESWPKMAVAIGSVLDRHPGEKVLVHTVSYALATYLFEHVGESGDQRPAFTYSDSRARDKVVSQFKGEVSERGAVIYAPSLERGFDFKNDDARVVIVAKIPYPNLGDRQVSQRLNTGSAGQNWYTVQTIRALVQMTGRGVRSADDWCVTYILDASFLNGLWKKDKKLLPRWWREAVDTRLTKRELGVRG